MMQRWKGLLKQSLVSHAPTLVYERGRQDDHDKRERGGDTPTLLTLLFLHLSSFIIPLFEPFMDVFRPQDYDLSRFRWARFTNALDGTSMPHVGFVRLVLYCGEDVVYRIEYSVTPGLRRTCIVHGDHRVLELEKLARKYRTIIAIAEKRILEKKVPMQPYELKITPREWAMLRTRTEYEALVTWVRDRGFILSLTSLDGQSMMVTVRRVPTLKATARCTTVIPTGEATEFELTAPFLPDQYVE